MNNKEIEFEMACVCGKGGNTTRVYKIAIKSL